MRVWDKVINKKNGVEGMIVAINDELQTIDVRCEEVTKTLTMAQFERYWDTTYAIKKPGPKPKVRHGPKPKPKKPGPKPKRKNPPKRTRSKYPIGDYRRVKEHRHKKIYKTRFPMEEIMNWIMELSEKYNMKFKLINDRDYKFWVLYNGEYSKNSPIMVRKYVTQVNLYTRSDYLTDDIKRNSRMQYIKYYYDKMLRIVNFTDDTKAYIEKVIKCINENYKPTERPKTYKSHKRKRRTK